MAKRSNSISSANITLDLSSDVPLYWQVYGGLRGAILSGRLVAGTRLPSTRDLTVELGVSRNTVKNAYEQLLSEGYLESHVGSGTYITRNLPDDLLNAGAASNAIAKRRARRKPALSKSGKTISEISVSASPNPDQSRPFALGVPALDAFPYEIWRRLLARRCSYPQRSLLGYGSAMGYRPLREAIAAYLGAARAVRCEPEQVTIVAGVQQALDMAARLLLDAGDVAWIEEYNYPAARAALLGAGARLVAVPVDDEGLDVQKGAALAPRARLVYITPSHQYPLGVTMSLARRLALLDWAKQSDAWILEDDYDSEYRYSGRPLAALQGLDQHGRVIYLGTFSKSVFPSLRLGYVIAPPDLVDAFSKARSLMSWCSSTVEQAALAEFIAEGHFARHIRRMRSLYAERQSALVEAARRELGESLRIQSHPAGVHLVGRLSERLDEASVSQQAAKLGVEAQPLFPFRLKRDGPSFLSGLVLGYGAYDSREIRQGVSILARAIDSVLKSSIKGLA